MEPEWLSLAAASKEELEVVTDILTGVIRCVSLHPHLVWSPCPPENVCSMASPLLILEESVHSCCQNGGSTCQRLSWRLWARILE